MEEQVRVAVLRSCDQNGLADALMRSGVQNGCSYALTVPTSDLYTC